MTNTPGRAITYTDGDRVLIEAEIVHGGRRLRTIEVTGDTSTQLYGDLEHFVIRSKITDSEGVASVSGSSRRAQDEPMIDGAYVLRVVERARAKYWLDGMSDEEFVAGVLAVVDLDGRLRSVSGTPDWAELRDRRTEDLNLRGVLSPNGRLDRVVPMELGDTLVPAVEWLVAERDRLAADADLLRDDLAGVTEQREQASRSYQRERDALAEERAARAKTIDNFEGYAEDHRGWDRVVRAAEAWRASNGRWTPPAQIRELVDAVDALTATVDQADECEGAPTNTTEGPEDTVRRYAGLLGQLEVELTDRGITLVDGPVDGAGIRTALDHIDRLTQTVDGLTWRAGVRADELRLLREERRRFLRDLRELQLALATATDRPAPRLARHAARPASTGEDAGLASTVATDPTPVNAPKLATQPTIPVSEHPAVINPPCICRHAKGSHAKPDQNGRCEFCFCLRYTRPAGLAESNLDGDR